MKNFLYIAAAASLTFLGTGCKPTLETPEPSAGPLNFSRYVAVGDYTTAGFMNGGLSRESQLTAYPNILAQQFATASGSAVPFEQPLFNSGGTQMVSLAFNPAGIPVLSNTTELANFLQSGCNSTTQNIIGDQYSTSPQQTASLQNLGVPGLKIAQVNLAGLGNDANVSKTNTPNQPAFYNPYFDRMLPDGDNRSYLEVVRNSKPTFFTVWVGMADVVNYAMSGGSCGVLPTVVQFQTELFNLVDSLSAGGKRQGVICNIPSVKYLGLPASITVQSQLQKHHNDPNLKIWIKALRIPNAPALGYDTVEVSSDDFITPTGISRLGIEEQVMVKGNLQTLPHGLNRLNPLLESEVLDRKEAETLESRISILNPSYNSVINNMINGKGSKFTNTVALANLQELYGRMYNGVNFNGVTYNLTAVKGGFYSYDYFTPTPRGQAIIANEIIRTINTKFKTNIFEVNVNNFQGFQNP